MFSTNSRLVCILFVDFKITRSCSMISFQVSLYLSSYNKIIVDPFVYFVNSYHVDFFFFFGIKDRNFIRYYMKNRTCNIKNRGKPDLFSRKINTTENKHSRKIILCRKTLQKNSNVQKNYTAEK